MTHLYFVRHAHSVYTPDEWNRPLSEKGLMDAGRLTELLSSEGIERVVSSPYRRAIQTVAGIADYVNADIEIMENFKERVLTASPAADFTSALSKVWEDENFSWEGGESNRVAQQRGVAATFEVLEKYEDQHIVIGMHGNLMVLIMNFFDRRYDFSFWQTLDMPDVYKLSFKGQILENAQKLWERKQCPALIDNLGCLSPLSLRFLKNLWI